MVSRQRSGDGRSLFFLKKENLPILSLLLKEMKRSRESIVLIRGKGRLELPEVFSSSKKKEGEHRPGRPSRPGQSSPAVIAWPRRRFPPDRTWGRGVLARVEVGEGHTKQGGSVARAAGVNLIDHRQFSGNHRPHRPHRPRQWPCPPRCSFSPSLPGRRTSFVYAFTQSHLNRPCYRINFGREVAAGLTAR